MYRFAIALLVLFMFASYGEASETTPGVEKIVVFTFDDGPRPNFLAGALPFFKKEHVPVTFFVVGKSAEMRPEWLKREMNEGHEIENHTMNHPCLVQVRSNGGVCHQITTAMAINEIRQANEVINRIIGYYPHFLRPPYLAMNSVRKAEIEKALEIKVLYPAYKSINPMDYILRNPATIVSRVTKEVNSHGDGTYIIVFHEKEATLKALPELVKFFREKNYEFLRLDELAKKKDIKI
jgi:peptidoglycan-N-acetylglucosamine deacetylase